MKNKLTASLLSLFLGGAGIHKFYLGQTGLGIIYLLFCWTFIPAIIGFIEGLILLSMSEEAFNEKYNGKMVQFGAREGKSVVEEKKEKKLGFWAWAGIIFVGLIIIGNIISVFDKEEPTTPKKSILDYSVYMDSSKNNIVRKTLLVAPETTKKQALELGEYFKKKYNNKQFVYIAIFDDKWAANNRFNTDVHENKILQHYLVQVTVNKKTGLSVVQWMKSE